MERNVHLHHASGIGAKSPAHPLGSFIGRKIPSAPLTGNPRSAKLCTKRNISVTLITKERLPDLLLKPYWYGGRAKNSPISGPYKSELLHGEWGRHGRISYSRRDNHFLSKRRGRHRWCGGTCSPYADFTTQIRQHDSQSQCITAQRLAKSAQSYAWAYTYRSAATSERSCASCSTCPIMAFKSSSAGKRLAIFSKKRPEKAAVTKLSCTA